MFCKERMNRYFTDTSIILILPGKVTFLARTVSQMARTVKDCNSCHLRYLLCQIQHKKRNLCYDTGRRGSPCIRRKCFLAMELVMVLAMVLAMVLVMETEGIGVASTYEESIDKLAKMRYCSV